MIMTPQRFLPWKSWPGIALLGAALIVLTGIATGLYNEEIYRIHRAREVSAQARILAASVTAALAFNDNATAQQYVNALRANPEVEAAGVYDERGVRVASYAKDGVAPPPRTRPRQGPVTQGSRVVIDMPVAEGETSLGAVFLRTTADPIGAVLARHAGVALLIIMTSLMVGLLGAAQAALSRANAQLADRARDLADANRELQVHMAERERAEEALRQSQKMEAIGQLTGGIAHDFNNILMVASSGLDLLETTRDPERRQKLRDGVRQAVDRGASLTRQLLAVARRTALQPQAIDIAGQIEGMRLLLDRSLREDISVRIELPANLWPVETDPTQLEVALLNIAVNARDAMPSGGVITISGQNVPGLAEETLKGDFVCLSVSDQGMGMSPDVLSRIFEPFFTTKGVGKGTGLGLSQVYGFGRASGGDVRVRSVLGQGTTVSIYLPRTAKTPRPIGGAAAEDAPHDAGGGRILMVEDDVGVADLVSEMLRELGYDVAHAPSAVVALDMLEADPKVDFVFSDMVMPGGMNGMELAREVARRRPDLPVLLTTGFSDAAEAAAREGLRLLLKPYRIDALAAALSAAREPRAV